MPLRLLYLLAIMLISSSSAYAQLGGVTGKVVTEENEPAAFVNITIAGTSIGTTSNEEGKYLLENLQPGSYNVIASFVGFQTIERQIEIVADNITKLNFTLVEISSELQEVVVQDSRTLNEKTIDIGKAGIKPMDLPQSTFVIDSKVLTNQQVGRLSDVLLNTSGVYLMGATGGYQEEVAARGFSFGSNNTFKNGVRFNNGVMPEMSSLERVEILKGSSAILFGNVAAGGVLNLVTKKPRFQHGGEISFRTGSYDSYKPSFDIYGPVSGSDVVAFRVNTTYENAGSFRDKVKSERIYFNPSFLIKAGKNTEITIEGDYLKDNRTLDYGTGAVNYEIAKLPRGRFLGASWSYYKGEQKSATVTLNHSFTQNLTLRAMAGYQGYYNDLFGTTRPNASSQFVQANGKWARGLQRSGTDQDYYVSQVDLISKFETGSIKHQALFGVEYDEYENLAITYTYKNPLENNKNVYDTINIYDLSTYVQRTDIPNVEKTGVTKNPVKRVGVYAQDMVTLFDKVKVLAGVRYSYIESESESSTTTSSYYDDPITARFGVVYQPSKHVSIFASYANSFTLNTNKGVNEEILPPSFIDQFELGSKTELFNGLLSANVAVYKIINSNLSQQILDKPGYFELAGEVTSKGLEVDVMSTEINGVSIMAGYSYNDTRYTKSTQYIEGSKLRYNPNHTANASAFYKFQNEKLKNLRIGFTTSYIGERMAGRSTRVTMENDTYKLIPVAAYFLFDLHAAYAINNVSLRAKVSNILNELSYNVHDDNSVNPIAPRLFTATLSYKW